MNLPKAFNVYRRLMVKTEMQFLRRPYHHSEAFVRGAFKNLKDGLEMLRVASGEGK